MKLETGITPLDGTLPTWPQFLDIVAQLLDDFDWCSPEQFAKKAGRSRSALSQSKVFSCEQQQQKGFLPRMICSIQNRQGLANCERTLS